MHCKQSHANHAVYIGGCVMVIMDDYGSLVNEQTMADISMLLHVILLENGQFRKSKTVVIEGTE